MSAHDADQHTVASGEKQDQNPSQMELDTVEVESVPSMIQCRNRCPVRRACWCGKVMESQTNWRAVSATSRGTMKPQRAAVNDCEQD